jgi:thiol-disulfide isomerase/thioredoxin
MKKLIKFITLTLVIFAFTSTSGLPNVTLKTLKGQLININELGQGDKPVILSFWSTHCAPCLRELKAVKEVYQDWQDETGVELYAISVDDNSSVSKVKPMVNRFGWDYTVLLDTDGELKRAMNVTDPPFLFIVHKGKIVYKHTGYTTGSEDEVYDKLIELTK